jgi:hypothetical protein
MAKSVAFVVKDLSAAATSIHVPKKGPKVCGVLLSARETVSLWGNLCTVYDPDAPPPWDPAAIFDLPGFRNILTFPVVFELHDDAKITPAAFKKMLEAFIIEGPGAADDGSDSEEEGGAALPPPPFDDDGATLMDEDAAADFDGDLSTEAEESESNDDEDYDEHEPDFS